MRYPERPRPPEPRSVKGEKTSSLILGHAESLPENKNLEKAAYARGYNAGAKSKSKKELDTIKAKEKAEFRRQVYIRTLAALVSGKQAWTVGDKKCTNAKDFAEVANNIAVQSLPYF